MKWAFRTLGLAFALFACLLVMLPHPAFATTCKSDDGDICICNGPCNATRTGCSCGIPQT